MYMEMNVGIFAHPHLARCRYPTGVQIELNPRRLTWSAGAFPGKASQSHLTGPRMHRRMGTVVQGYTWDPVLWNRLIFILEAETDSRWTAWGLVGWQPLTTALLRPLAGWSIALVTKPFCPSGASTPSPALQVDNFVRSLQ